MVHARRVHGTTDAARGIPVRSLSRCFHSLPPFLQVEDGDAVLAASVGRGEAHVVCVELGSGRLLAWGDNTMNLLPITGPMLVP